MDIIQSIYKSCDHKNTNSVHVSSLIEFIEPYMISNLGELVELQNQLDPEKSDPLIKYSFFERVMSDWIAKMQGSSVGNSLAEFSTSFSQTFSQHDVSNTKSNNNNTLNDVALEEQVCNLKYQLHKTTAELDLVKQQLTSCEEQNEAVLAELKMYHQTHPRYQSDDVEGEFSPDREDDLSKQEEKRKREQLEKMLAISEKQQELLLAQIHQLENENHTLKNRLQTSETIKREGRKSLGEMRDSLDLKETEISTLMEVIESLKCELEEKDERLSFYTNEHQLLRSRIQQLEFFLQSSTCRGNLIRSVSPKNDGFNTPKLLNQLAHPISPILNVKKFDTSSPVKNPLLESGNSSDFFDIDLVHTMLQSPRKSLKEELSEINMSGEKSSPKNDEGEIARLHRLVEHQEDIKNNLWQNMKQLLNDNASLEDYKKDYFDLLYKMEEKSSEIDRLQRELEDARRNDGIQNLQYNLTDLETNLKNQMDLNTDLQNNVQVLGEALNREERKLTTQINYLKKCLFKERTKNAMLLIKKKCCDKSIETEKEEYKTGQKKTNFTKHELKMERLLERLENTEKKLTTERTINTKMTQKYHETCEKILKLEDDLNYGQKKLCETEKNLSDAVIEKNSFLKRIEMLEQERTNLLVQIDQVNNYNKELANHNYSVISALNNLRVEHELSLGKQFQMEEKLKEAYTIKKQLIDSRTSSDLTIQQLQNDVAEKRSELKFLEKQLGVENGKLKNLILDTINIVRVDDELRQGIFQKNDQLEDGIIILRHNINNITLLLQILSEKYLSQLNEERSGDEVHDEDSFVSCSSETSFVEIKISDLIPLECNSFLENVCFDADLRLSHKEIEERFATLALLLTVDSKTAEKRYICEEKKFNHLIFKFFSSINDAIDFLNSNKRSKGCKNLQMLKDISEDVLRSAFQCGVLHYEKRTASCWKLVINYVAMLKRQRKECFKDSDETVDDDKSVGGTVLANTPLSSNLFKRIKFCVCSLFLIIVGCVVALIFYVDQMCPKTGKRTCPVQWMTNLFIEKTYHV